MEKAINDFSLSLFLWQTLVIVLGIIIIYYLIKLYKKISNHYDVKK